MDLFFIPAKEILDNGSVVIELNIGQSPRKISGIQKLIQIWINKFLSSPGRNIFDLNGGGGVLSMIGNNINTTTTDSLKGLLAAAINKTNKEVFEDQLVDEDSEDDELLASATLLGVEIIAEDEININIQIVSQAGTSQALVVPIS